MKKEKNKNTLSKVEKAAWGVSGIGTLPRMLQSLHFLGVSPRDCHGRSESAAHSGILNKSFTPSHPLGTTCTGFFVCGSSLKSPTRHRVLLRNSCHHYSVEKSRHRFSSKRILGFQESRLLNCSYQNFEGQGINPSARLFLLIHRIRSMASLLSTFSFNSNTLYYDAPVSANGLLNF